jgi:signal transduction histidine kinase
MLRKIATPFKLVLVYILFLLFLAGDDILEATHSISEQVRNTETSYRLADDALEAIRLDIYKIAVTARDGLLSQRPGDARAVVIENEREIETQIHFLRKKATADNVTNIQHIEDDVHTYLKAIFSVTDQAYSADSRRRLDNALGSRQSIVHLSAAFSKWNDSNFEVEQKAIGRSIRNLRTEIITILALIALLGTAAGGAALYRMSGIEKSNQQAHGKVTKAQEELKSLSRQLVSAQEEERKALSRELHDEIGQSLTALKFELANSEKIARAEGSPVMVHLQNMREIADQTLRASKNISLGLRPPMLDDLGLVSALTWFTAEFSRRTGISVEMTADGEMSRLNEAHRTCVFRVVQESLTNCARHSQAKSVTVQLDSNEELLTLTVADDGAGFEPGKRVGTGLGLLSMQERAAELGGTFEIVSHPGNGTRIQITIPTASVVI